MSECLRYLTEYEFSHLTEYELANLEECEESPCSYIPFAFTDKWTEDMNSPTENWYDFNEVYKRWTIMNNYRMTCRPSFVEEPSPLDWPNIPSV